MHMDEDDIQRNSKRAYRNYKVLDKVMLANNNAFVYETPYKGPF